MPINQHALEAIRHSTISGEDIATLFEQMTEDTQGVGASGGLFILSYIDPDNLPEEGELVPTLTMALKPFTNQQPSKPE